MMHSLELQAAVHEIQPRRTVYVHSGAQHFLGEGFVWAVVFGAHGEMGEGDLDVQGGGDAVGYEDVEDSGVDGGDAAVEEEVAEPVPEHDLAGDLEVAVPPGGAFGRGLAEEEVFPGADVEVEAAEEEDGVVEPVLVGDGEAGEGVEVHDFVVVGASEGIEKAWGDREKGDVFDVGIVFGGVGDDMVDVVIAFPPADTQPTHEVGDEDADAGVDVEVVRDAHVAGVVGGEDKLVPDEAEKEGGEGVVTVVEESEGGGDEDEVAEAFYGVGGVGAVVETLCMEPNV